MSQNRGGRSRAISPIQMTHIQPILLHLILMVTMTIQSLTNVDLQIQQHLLQIAKFPS